MSEDLRKKLIDLGTSNPLFTIRPGQDCDLYLEHEIVDAEYYGVASKEKVMKSYSAKMWLVEEDRTLKYREIIQEEDRWQSDNYRGCVYKYVEKKLSEAKTQSN